MPQTTAEKLKIKEGFTLRTLHAPGSFLTHLGELPAGVRISNKAKPFQQLHWFVQSQAQLKGEINEVLSLLSEGVRCWIYFPKGSSNIQTDLTRDKGWEILQKQPKLQWLGLVSLDETWSAFAVRLAGAAPKKTATPKAKPVESFIDAATRQVFLPDDFAALLAKAPKEKAFFDTLSFTNKKEYVEWIVMAKKAETRASRLKGSLERLAKDWKNPANR